MDIRAINNSMLTASIMTTNATRMVAGSQSNESLVKEIINVIQASDLGWTLKRAVQDELSKSFVNVKDIKRLVPVSHACAEYLYQCSVLTL